MLNYESKTSPPDLPPCTREIRDTVDLPTNLSILAQPLRSPVPVPGEKVLRIVLADEETMFRESLRVYLEIGGRFEVVGASADRDATIDLIRRLKPDVLLLDSRILLPEGVEMLREFKRSQADVKVILLCHAIEKTDIVHALQLGVRGIVLKTDPTDSLLECIQKVFEGEYWLGKYSVVKLVQAVCEPDISNRLKKSKYGLTPRESQIIEAVLEGCSNPEIAANLSVSEQTVKHHMSHIFDKLGVYSRLELALFAVNHGINPQ